MENSHRRIIAELEEKHRQETESLKLEKEQALAEETHATLAGKWRLLLFIEWPITNVKNKMLYIVTSFCSVGRDEKSARS